MNTYKNTRKTGVSPKISRTLTNRDKQLYSFYVNRDLIIRNWDTKKVKLEVVGKLETACLLAGIREENVPADAVMKKMAELVVDNFGFLHPDEITYAFELAFLGVLDLNEYQIDNLGFFDWPYVTKILRAYLVYRTDRVQYVQGLLAQETALQKRRMKREEQSFETISEIKGLYDRYIRSGGFSQGNVPYHVKPTYIYLFMEYIGLIRISPDVKKVLFDSAWKEVLPQVVKDLRQPLSSFETRIATYKAEDLFRYRAILVVFARWKEEGKTIHQIYDLLNAHCGAIDPDLAFELIP